MNLSPAGNAWQKLVFNIAGAEYHDFVTLAFGWQKVVGKLLAERTELIKLEHDVLFVSVMNNVWMQELIIRKSQILIDIESILAIKLKEIVFFIGQEKPRIGRKKWSK